MIIFQRAVQETLGRYLVIFNLYIDIGFRMLFSRFDKEDKHFACVCYCFL